jgi:hypothetical protein
MAAFRDHAAPGLQVRHHIGPDKAAMLQVLARSFVVCDWLVEIDVAGEVIRADRAQDGGDGN